MKKLLSSLTQLGLSENEAKTYVTLLDVGKASVVDLARRTHISRSTLYDVISTLLEQGLITESMNGKRKVYVAEHPETVHRILKERMARFTELLPEFISLTNVSTTKPTIEYLEGVSGIKKAFLDAARSKNHEIIAFVGLDHLLARSRVLERFWYGGFRKAKEKNKVYSKLILPDTDEAREFKAHDEENFRESRFVPASTYNFPAEILVYDDVVVFFSYNEREEFALKMRSAAISQTVEMVFRMAWNLSY